MHNRARQNLITVPPPPARFTMDEWHLNNTQQYRISEDQRQLAERIINESERIIDETNNIVNKNKKEVDHHIEIKIHDINFCKNQLEFQKKELDLEIEALKTYKERIEDAQQSLQTNAENICKKCLILREGRLGIDLCCDIVEIELKKEFEVIDGARSLLSRCLEQVKEQIRRTRAMIYTLVRDLEDKTNVLVIDKHNASLKETSLNLSMYQGIASLNPADITKEEWRAFSQQNIDDAVKELVAGRPLRSYIDMLLLQVIEDLLKQYNIVNEAFKERIEEYKESKGKLEKQHFEIVKQANEMIRNITQLEKAIAEKEGFMALAHTRLGNRSQRPGAELCRDEVDAKLVEEVKEIKDVVTNLQQMLAESQASLRYLLKSQVQLEEDINIKTNSLKIDEVDCMTSRLGMDYHIF
ncbi:tektin C [Lycorma delicatula]|uniref:tektin C n=1 Tax=Lycorma delicatula TaxID=130591 RepID=UPI003F516E02